MCGIELVTSVMNQNNKNASNGKTVCQMKEFSTEPACLSHRVQIFLQVQGWPCCKGDGCACLKAVFFNELQDGKCDHDAPKEHCKV